MCHCHLFTPLRVSECKAEASNSEPIHRQPGWLSDCAPAHFISILQAGPLESLFVKARMATKNRKACEQNFSEGRHEGRRPPILQIYFPFLALTEPTAMRERPPWRSPSQGAYIVQEQMPQTSSQTKVLSVVFRHLWYPRWFPLARHAPVHWSLPRFVQCVACCVVWSAKSKILGTSRKTGFLRRKRLSFWARINKSPQDVGPRVISCSAELANTPRATDLTELCGRTGRI